MELVPAGPAAVPGIDPTGGSWHSLKPPMDVFPIKSLVGACIGEALSAQHFRTSRATSGARPRASLG